MAAPYKRPIIEDPTSYERTGIPRGDPRRFASHGVRRMVQCTQPYKNQNEAAPVEEIETEAQRQLHAIAKNQISTTCTLEKLSKSARQFTEARTQRPMQTEGVSNLAEYEQLTIYHSTENELRQAGLTEDEIKFKLQADKYEQSELSRKRRYGEDPVIHAARMENINKRITLHKTKLSQPDTFSNATYMSRQSRDLEAAISHDKNKAKLLANLTTDKPATGSEPDDPDHPINHLDHMWQQMQAKTMSNENICDTDEPIDFKRIGCMTKKQAVEHCNYEDNAKSEQIIHKCAQCTDNESCSRPIDNIESCVNCHNSAMNKEKDKSYSGNSPFGNWKPVGNVTVSDGQNKSKMDTYRKQEWQTVWPPPVTDEMRKLMKLATVQHDLNDVKSRSNQTSNQSTKKAKPASVRGVTLDELREGRLSMEEVKKKMPKCKDFQSGEPSNVLYIQNLPRSGFSEQDILGLFLYFQRADESEICVRRMTGRMKGQAFVTFHSVGTATEALAAVNGFQIEDQPILIKFGKTKETS